jgi:hypothetical protein
LHCGNTVDINYKKANIEALNKAQQLEEFKLKDIRIEQQTPVIIPVNLDNNNKLVNQVFGINSKVEGDNKQVNTHRPSPSPSPPTPSFIDRKQQQQHHQQKQQVDTSSNSIDSKLNTTVIAGIVTSIGLIIVFINLIVLFVCRRNLKKLIKTTKGGSNSSDCDINTDSVFGLPSREGMIQEYFDTFNIPNNHLQNAKTMLPASKFNAAIAAAAALHKHQQQQHMNTLHNFVNKNGPSSNTMNHHLSSVGQIRTNSSSSSSSSGSTASTSGGCCVSAGSGSGDDLLLNDSAQHVAAAATFFNQISTQRQSSATSAFKPYNLMNNEQTNQYDRMNHHQFMLKGPVSSNNCTDISSNDDEVQYAHTYESLDILQDANNRNRSNINSQQQMTTSYRTVNQQQQQQQLEFLQSPLSIDHINPNLSSTTSTSSSSGNSSTHQLLKNNNNHQHNQNNSHFIKLNIENSHQFLNGDLNNLNLVHLQPVIGHYNQHYNQPHNNNNNNNNNNNSNVTNFPTAWNPETTYYSSIPTLLTNYPNSVGFNNQMTLQNHQHQQQLKLQQQQQQQQIHGNQTNDNNSNLDNFKSHLV